MSPADLKDLCTSVGAKATSKAERVEQVLAKWLQDDGVNKTLAKIAHDQREQELNALEKPALQKLCEKANIDPFVKDVLVDRITKKEIEAGKFKKPTLAPLERSVPIGAEKTNTDMVEALLAQKRQDDEAAERRAKEEAAVTSKIKELKSKSIDELKKLLKKNNLEVSGKKEEMVEALFSVMAEEDAAT